MSRRPSVTLWMGRRFHACRRGLWEGGVALRGCALLLSFPFFPPPRPSSPSVLQPSPPHTYRLQVLLSFSCSSHHLIFLLLFLLLPISVLHLPPGNVCAVAGCHATLGPSPFWFNGHTRRNFSKAELLCGSSASSRLSVSPLSLPVWGIKFCLGGGLDNLCLLFLFCFLYWTGVSSRLAWRKTDTLSDFPIHRVVLDKVLLLSDQVSESLATNQRAEESHKQEDWC